MTQRETSLYNGGMSIVFADITRALERREVKAQGFTPPASDGHLMESIARPSDGDTIQVGTPLVYGAVHQFGWDEKNIPARPFLGLSTENEADLHDTLNRFIEGIQ